MARHSVHKRKSGKKDTREAISSPDSDMGADVALFIFVCPACRNEAIVSSPLTASPPLCVKCGSVTLLDRLKTE